MMEITQGQILSVEKLSFPVLVVSRDFFNQSEQAIVCPIYQKAAPGPLHISIETEQVSGIVLCEQMKLLDLRKRGHSKKSEISLEALMDITDAIQGIFDYYPYNGSLGGT